MTGLLIHKAAQVVGADTALPDVMRYNRID